MKSFYTVNTVRDCHRRGELSHWNHFASALTLVLGETLMISLSSVFAETRNLSFVRTFVRCSKAYAIPKSFPSVHLSPRKAMPNLFHVSQLFSFKKKAEQLLQGCSGYVRNSGGCIYQATGQSCNSSI